MKYSISDLLAFIDDGWIDAMSNEKRSDFIIEIQENIDEYQGQISLARRFAPSNDDLDMLDYLDSLLIDIVYNRTIFS